MEIVVWLLRMQSGLSYDGVSFVLVVCELNWEETSNMIYVDMLFY
jgi:hypothetical protein